jgi:hypothetical protein
MVLRRFMNWANMNLIHEKRRLIQRRGLEIEEAWKSQRAAN